MTNTGLLKFESFEFRSITSISLIGLASGEVVISIGLEPSSFESSTVNFDGWSGSESDAGENDVSSFGVFTLGSSCLHLVDKEKYKYLIENNSIFKYKSSSCF